MADQYLWLEDWQNSLDTARREGKNVLMQFHRDDCAGCKKLYEQTYVDPDVKRELIKWFIPLRQDIFQNREIRSKYAAFWTPSFYFLNTKSNSVYAMNGFLNIEDFRVLMRLGKAALDIPRGRYLQTIDLMDDGLEKFPSNPKAPAMLFMRGMAAYLLGNEKNAFREAMSEICEQYPNSQEARMWPWMDR